ncbi:ABC transporter ATP-binding protein [Gryllotalpicola ginsengisoli]|uniref:ABC transporter ATP-binding protein n=1 Tax=Gryllotalpicola ginsengisoli TaxID=444608 RepID=UPI0003B68786|nr:ABC transporter ATP-binding protein [Gryllotalpicola ginsengisoli]
MSPLLSVSDLTVAFRVGGERTEVVRGLDFTLERGRTLGLVGESGSGKSMTSLAIMGLLPPGAEISGGITFDGIELIGCSEHRLQKLRGERMAMIFQDPLSSLNPYYTVGLQIEETYRAHRGGSRRAARRVAIDAMKRVHIRDAESRVDQYPHQFSGGMRQRIMIAMALCLEPDLIIADEPTTALDVTVQARILDLLGEVQRATDAAMLFISHDLAVVSQVADDVVVLRHGDTMEAGPTEQIFCTPASSYTQELLDAIPRISDPLEARDRPAGPDKQPADAPEHVPLLDVRGLSKVYGSRTHPFTAVDDVSFEIGERETLAVVGESGSGKSTTARMVAKLIEPTTGTISFAGHDVTHADAETLAAFRKDVQVVFQDPFSSLNPRHTVGRIITAPGRYQGVDASAGRRWAQELMERVGLDPDHIDRYPWQFSGGQAQRIGIARALAVRPRLVICDEAVSALDVSVQARILELLADLQDDFGLSYLFIAHDLAVVRRLADRVAVMNQGRIVECGSRDEVFESPRDDYTRTLLAAVPTIPAEWDARRLLHTAPVPVASDHG